MPILDDDRSADQKGSTGREQEGRNLAIAAESLYVVNLLLIPVLAFLVLLYLYLRHRASASPLARNHLEQTVGASLWLAVFFAALAMLVTVLYLQGVQEVSLWVLVVIVFTIVHATMVLLGVVGLSRAMSGKCYRYPLPGKRMSSGCQP